MSDLETRRAQRQAALFGEGGVTALEAARLAASEARTGGAQGVTLRPYQVEARDACVRLFAEGTRRVLVNLPTGTGKTVFGFALAKHLGHRLVWIAHRDELIRQPIATAERVWPEVSRGIVQARLDQHARHVVVASVQTLVQDRRLDLVLKYGAPGLVVVDECHHAASDSYQKVLERLGCFAEKGPALLGLTATLERADGVGLGSVFETIAYRLSLHDAIERGYLASFRSEKIPLPLSSEVRAILERSGTTHDAQGEGDDVDEKKLGRELLRAGAAEATARAVFEHARDRKAIVFTCTIEQAERTSEELRKLGLRAEHVSGLMKRRERQGVLERLASGETRIVCNAQVLTEGFDEPTVDCVVMARPTKSRALYVQAVGRGLRLHPSKRDCLILDVVFASDLGLQTAATLDNQPVSELFIGGGSSRNVDPETKADAEDARVTAYLKTATGEGSDVRAPSGPRWLTVTATCWAFSLWPEGTLVVDRVPEHEGVFEAFFMPRDRSPSVRVSDPGPFEWVFGVAEDYLREHASHLLGTAPRWRRGPASDAQNAELARRGFAPVRTSGEAADLLTTSTVAARLGYA